MSRKVFLFGFGGCRQRVGKGGFCFLKRAVVATSICIASGLVAKGQSPYLNLHYDDLTVLIRLGGLDVMEQDSSRIHCVDVKKYRNVILHFSQGICYRVVTTFQNHWDFIKEASLMDEAYGDYECMRWLIPMDGGYDDVVGSQKKGYDIIQETFEYELESNE